MNLKKIALTIGLMSYTLLAFSESYDSIVFQLDDLTPDQITKLKELSHISSKDVVDIIHDEAVNDILTPEQREKLKVLHLKEAHDLDETTDWYEDPQKAGKN